jgi:D-alanyl-D-alanine carboxypeptidase
MSMLRAPGLKSSIFLVLIATTIVLDGCGGASAPPPQSSSLGSTVDSIARAAMQEQGVPGMTVALAKNGMALYAQAYGVSNLTSGQAMQPGAVFEIGSITKQFTATLIMKLQEQGRLDVNDSISSYLPEYNFQPAITLRMMLTHTSGLADFTNFPQLGAVCVGR